MAKRVKDDGKLRDIEKRLAVDEAIVGRRLRSATENDLRVTAYLTPALAASLEKYMGKHGGTRSKALRDAMADLFEKESQASNLRAENGKILVRNRKETRFQIAVLLKAIEEALDYDPQRHHNQPPPLLRIENPSYLEELRLLVIELRRLNENLEASRPTGTKPANNKAVERSAIEVKKHVNTFLNNYAGMLGKTLAVGSGTLVIGGLTTLLYQLDDRFHETSLHGTISLLADSSFWLVETRIAAMGRWRQAVELALSDEDIIKLTAISRSRTERGSRVARARMLLAYRENPSFFAIGRAVGVHHQTVERCIERAVAYGPLSALDDRPRPGREPTITPEAKAWLVSLACDKAKDHGYPHELWTTRLLADHARKRGPAAGHRCLTHLVQGTVCKILGNEEIKPHKVRYYLENRDAEFERKMAEVLCVYREVEVLKKARAKSSKGKPVAIVSCDEKPGIQAIATTAPDLPPEPGIHPTFARDHEYKRHGTLSLLAGIDLLTGKVHALVKDRHRSREFIEFLKLLDAAYPAGTAIKLILDNHSAHISKETKAWLATRPTGRFEFTFTPTHGSWLNLIEGFFSKLTRSVLRHIRVTSKLELKQRIMAGIHDINRRPVIHTWSYKLAEAA